MFWETELVRCLPYGVCAGGNHGVRKIALVRCPPGSPQPQQPSNPEGANQLR